MDTPIWIYPTIIITLAVLYFFFRSKNAKKTLKEMNVNDESYLPAELPWKIKSYESTDLALYHPPKALALTDNLKNHIGHVIKATPVAKDIVKNEKKVVIKFSEDVINKLKSGELKIMKKKGSSDQFRALAVNNKGTFKAQGWFEVKNIKKVNPAQLTNAVLGVMTVVTAQEHLDKINKQLNSIDKKIDTLLRLYHNDSFGKIQGSIRYLKSILPSLYDQGKNSIYTSKVEDISLQSYTEIESVLPELPFLINKANLIKGKAKFSMEKVVNEFTELSSTFEQKMLIGLGNLEVMSICLKINSDLWNKSEVNLNRLDDIEKYFKQLVDFQEEFNAILNDKNLGLDATFRTSKAISKKREEIEKHLSYHNENIISSRSSIDQHIMQLRNSDQTKLEEPVDLQVEYDDNDNIMAVYRLKQVN